MGRERDSGDGIGCNFAGSVATQPARTSSIHSRERLSRHAPRRLRNSWGWFVLPGVVQLTLAISTAISTVAVLAAIPLADAAHAAGGPGTRGVFATPCGYSHSAPDDPIVHPGRPGASHLHDFIGSTTTNATSTFDSLRAGGTLCRRAADHSAYWAPALRRGGRRVLPTGATAYYRTADRSPGSIRPFPAGLRMIAGDPGATAPQDPRVIRWGCTGRVQPHASDRARRTARKRLGLRFTRAISRLRRTAGRGARRARAIRRMRLKLRRALRRVDRRHGGVPTCPRGARLRLAVTFPDCWDGTRLDSADHRSHLAQTLRVRGALNRCPASHPVAVPSLTVRLSYRTRGGPGVRLASGSANGAHADFFNAWDPAALADLVERCLNADVHCGTK